MASSGTEVADPQPAPTFIGRKLYGGPPFNTAADKPLRGKKAGVYMDWAEQASPQVLGLFLKAVRQLASTGCQARHLQNCQQCNTSPAFPVNTLKAMQVLHVTRSKLVKIVEASNAA